MRDGIYRDAKVPKEWCKAGEVHLNDADWEEAGPLYVTRALLTDLRSAVEPSLLMKVAEYLQHRQPNLFDTADHIWRKCSGGRDPNVFEESLLAHLRRRADGRCLRREYLVESLNDAISERCEARIRELRTHLDVRAPDKRRVILPRFQSVLSKLRFATISEELILGKHPRLPSLRGQGNDPDADVL